jgi:hypothetical protein
VYISRAAAGEEGGLWSVGESVSGLGFPVEAGELCAGLGMVVVVAEKGGGRSRGQSGTRSRQRVLYHNSSDGGKQ